MNQARDIIVGWLSRLPTTAGAGTIGPDTDLIEAGIIDSLAILDLVGFLEQRFKITFPVEEFVPENFRTATAIAAVSARLGGTLPP
jgi:acyl carrier protein